MSHGGLENQARMKSSGVKSYRKYTAQSSSSHDNANQTATTKGHTLFESWTPLLRGEDFSVQEGRHMSTSCVWQHWWTTGQFRAVETKETLQYPGMDSPAGCQTPCVCTFTETHCITGVDGSTERSTTTSAFSPSLRHSLSVCWPLRKAAGHYQTCPHHQVMVVGSPFSFSAALSHLPVNTTLFPSLSLLFYFSCEYLLGIHCVPSTMTGGD